MYKAIIFDVDGTILDTEKAVLHSLQTVLADEGVNYELDELRFVLGITGAAAVEQLNILDQERVLDKWIEREASFIDEVEVFEGIHQVLHAIPASGVVTSKNALEMDKGFYPFDIHHHFQAIVCASDTENHKPHPDPLLKGMELLGREPNEVLYVGDSIYDMKCAHAAGAHFGLALWGAKTTKGFENAELIFEKPEDILAYVSK
ncbi:HAD family hydrolase [Listeria welshimeri]|nr:HAD family hydrolase [Listeria welshimeri]MBC1702370.1 HAD family hydrolase [Listeria welshimeri]MBC1956638.1 HAD family hydrolase [Listeria welshimeri]